MGHYRSGLQAARQHVSDGSEIHLNAVCFPIEVVDHSEHPERPAVNRLIMHKDNRAHLSAETLWTKKFLRILLELQKSDQ